MGNDVQAWRARIGMFNGSPKNIHSVKKTYLSFSILDMFPHKLFLTLSSSINVMGSLVAHCCLLILLLIEISTAFATKRPSFNNKLCKKIMLQSFCNPCLVAFLSLLMRMLLLRSGNVESNPGPRPNSFSIGCWNVDSLLTREGVKKDYLESIQSIHHFDLFGICETYLNTDTKPENLVIAGFSPNPIRADYKGTSTRPRGGVCLYYKDATPIKHRPDLEIMEETIVAEIKINRKSIIYILSYRSPSQSTSEFKKYTEDLDKIYNKALAENPYMIILTGDYNARSPLL